ncbi:MAG: hypothetical protein J7L78_02575, partial [Dehalococcoidales bacterium]|nr:hypothetical protein [Dehalococcoidales bacterium]
MMKKHLLIITCLLIITPFVCTYTESLSKDVIATIYHAVFPPKSKGGVTLDDYGVPIVDYGYDDGNYIGKQRNPVTIAQKGFFYWDEYQAGGKTNDNKKLFLNCAQWLRNNAVSYGTYAVWEYNFP